VHMISVIFPSANNFYMAALSYSKYVGNLMSEVQSFEGPDTVISLKFGDILVRGKAPAVNRVSYLHLQARFIANHYLLYEFMKDKTLSKKFAEFYGYKLKSKSNRSTRKTPEPRIKECDNKEAISPRLDHSSTMRSITHTIAVNDIIPDSVAIDNEREYESNEEYHDDGSSARYQTKEQSRYDSGDRVSRGYVADGSSDRPKRSCLRVNPFAKTDAQSDE
jgi:hypothetical protein